MQTLFFLLERLLRFFLFVWNIFGSLLEKKEVLFRIVFPLWSDTVVFDGWAIFLFQTIPIYINMQFTYVAWYNDDFFVFFVCLYELGFKDEKEVFKCSHFSKKKEKTQQYGVFLLLFCLFYHLFSFRFISRFLWYNNILVMK